ILGGILGGVLGHQVGSGRGNDAATAGGAVAGAVIGSNVGRNGRDEYGRDVRRCETVSSGTPEYWDVTYTYRGVEHRVQMSEPPAGRTIAVNRRGEPRG
ncbi:MAG TPA: glycine zipper 2TM domain-containing protein, partial [Myxococcota bacterium]|nr:glycine zipper 2TM domain-containing protein [Myxococcota bacterium]